MSARRRLSAAAVLALATLVGGCARLAGDAPGSGGIDQPTDPPELVLRVSSGGGFVPVRSQVTQVPFVSLYGDGRLITLGPQIEIYPGPALPNLLVRRLTAEAVREILRAARDAGLHGPDRHYEDPTIVDAPTTTFTVAAGGERHVTRVEALAEGAREVPGEEGGARERLMAFWGRLGDLQRWLPEGSVGPERPFDFHDLRVFVVPKEGEEAPPELSQEEVEWPLAVPLEELTRPVAGAPGVRCGTVEGDDLDVVLSAARRANELTFWRDGGETYRLAFRPLLPDEGGCPEDVGS